MLKSESIGKLALALSKAQKEIIGAVKDSNNPFFKSKYADLASVMEAIREPFAKNELSYSQLTSVTPDGSLLVETILMHSSGEYLVSSYPVHTKDLNPQTILAAVTYARRGSLSAIAGVSQVDDDGNSQVDDDGNSQVNTSVHTQSPKQLPNYAPQAEERKPNQITTKTDTVSQGKANKIVTAGQIKRLEAIQRTSNKSYADVMKHIRETYKIDLEKLNMLQYDEVIEWIQNTPPVSEDIPF